MNLCIHQTCVRAGKDHKVGYIPTLTSFAVAVGHVPPHDCTESFSEHTAHTHTHTHGYACSNYPSLLNLTASIHEPWQPSDQPPPLCCSTEYTVCRRPISLLFDRLAEDTVVFVDRQIIKKKSNYYTHDCPLFCQLGSHERGSHHVWTVWELSYKYSYR